MSQPRTSLFHISLMMDEDFILLVRRKDAQIPHDWIKRLSNEKPSNWSLIKQVWNDTFCVNEDLPEQTVIRWNKYADAADMPIEFRRDGCIEIVCRENVSA